MNDQNEAVKHKIISAAKMLFFELGYDGTSERNICDEAEVALPLITYHFGGKENVLLAILEPLKSLPLPEVTDSPEKDLQIFLEVTFVFFTEHRDVIQILWQELGMNSPRSKKIVPFLLVMVNKLTLILESGVDQGVFKIKSMQNAIPFVMGSIMAFSMTGILSGYFESKADVKAASVKEIYELIYQGIG